EVLDRLAAGSTRIACHGRDRDGLAAALTGWTLVRAGLDPTVLLADAATQLGGWCRRGGGPHLVIESCLSDRAPDYLALLDPSAAAHDAMRARIAAMPASGYLAAWCGPGLSDALGIAVATVETLGTGRRGLDWSAAVEVDERGRPRLRVFRRGRFVLEARPRPLGPGMGPGILAAVAIADRLGVGSTAIREAIEEFEGPGRRLATLGSYRGARLIDDASEGPRGVAEALASCRRAFAPRRLFVAYQGTSWPAGPIAIARLGAALAEADAAWAVAAPATLLGAWRALGLPVRAAAGPVAAALELSRRLGPGDLLLTLGAVAVGKVADEFLRRLPNRRQAG
ncbi:MAG TPA: hypothetical protein VG406_05435, partial [Isosphaeraceae bacterium]|nr:hypothetical protein [Isosphaeraceae bacterium]